MKVEFVKYQEGRETWFEANYNGMLISVLQENVGCNNGWNVRVNHQYLINSDMYPQTFHSFDEAVSVLGEHIEDGNLNENLGRGW